MRTSFERPLAVASWDRPRRQRSSDPRHRSRESLGAEPVSGSQYLDEIPLQTLEAEASASVDDYNRALMLSKARRQPTWPEDIPEEYTSEMPRPRHDYEPRNIVYRRPRFDVSQSELDSGDEPEEDVGSTASMDFADATGGRRTELVPAISHASELNSTMNAFTSGFKHTTIWSVDQSSYTGDLFSDGEHSALLSNMSGARNPLFRWM